MIAIRGNDLAEEAGNSLALNMVMLGALVGSNTVPVTAEVMRKTISIHTKKAFIESNLRALDLGIKEVQGFKRS